MIPPPPANAKPSLEQALMWAFFMGLGMTLGTPIANLAAGRVTDWDGHVFGQFVVTAIVSLPVLVMLLATALSGGGRRPLPGGMMVWGGPATLFYRAVRASLFLCGFVILYVLVAVVMGGGFQPWQGGAVVHAAITIAWFMAVRFLMWPKNGGQTP